MGKSRIEQREDVADDGLLGGGQIGRDGGRREGGGAGEKGSDAVDNGEVEAVGGDIDACDGGGGFVDLESDVDSAPIELGRALGGEVFPTTVFPCAPVEQANTCSGLLF